MCEDLIGDYGVITPLSVRQSIELSRDVESFEEETDFVLAPFLLESEFIDQLAEKVESLQAEVETDWNIIWAMVHQQDTVVGFLDFAGPPNDRGDVILRWSINPEWKNGPFEREALGKLLEWAFSRKECLSVSVIKGFSEVDRAETLRRLGFRSEQAKSGRESYRCIKTVEGRLL
ncbi:MAG: hypothetical protein RQ801_07025 [Spirochaetaceae bacterium]|nr:hypothetical protein [Spirochaetaceae bacterium]MDT8298033.1 hypothetical protein [Spirochaetaceae bacterium]